MTLRQVRACPASMLEQPASAQVSAAAAANLLEALMVQLQGATSHSPTVLRSGHGAGVCGLVGDRLRHVAMLNDFTVLQPADVDDGHFALIRLAEAMHVEDHAIAIGKRA